MDIMSALPRRAMRFRFTALSLILSLVALHAASIAETPRPKERLDLSRMHLTFDEKFNSLDVSAHGPGTRWIPHTPWSGDFGDAAFSDPEPGFPFTVHNGVLQIEARKEPDGRWRSGLLASADSNGAGFSQKYGYFEMRAKLPKGKDLWPAFWLDSVADTTKDSSVEIDALEHYGQFPDLFNSTLHVWFTNGTSRSEPLHTQQVSLNSLYNDFNTYGILIEADWIKFYLDRVEYWRTRTPPELRQSIILLNLALGSGWPIDEAPSPSFMLVDYVRVYAVSPH
jgi:beta-glucanase (GH16 family)